MLPYDNEIDTGFDFLSPEKLEIIYRYLEDQQKLIDPSQVVPLSPSEASISPVSTPIPEPTSENGIFIDNLLKPNTDARALYNMFALPVALSNGSTDLLSMSQKSQGMELNDKPLNIDTSRNNNCSEKPRNEFKKNFHLRVKDSSKPLNSNLKESNLSKRNAASSFNVKDRSNLNLISKKPKNKRHSPFPKRLPKHRITLPKLERVNPTENAKRWLDTLQFSEKDFLGLEDKKRLVVINNLSSKNTLVASSPQSASLFQTESQSRFFPRIYESEASNKHQPSSFRKHALSPSQKNASLDDLFYFDVNQLDFSKKKTTKKFMNKKISCKKTFESPVDENIHTVTGGPLLTSFFGNLVIHSEINQAPFLNSSSESIFMYNNRIRLI